MKLLGFDSRKNKLFWEGLGLALLILTVLIVSGILYFFDVPEFEQTLKSLGFVFSVVFFVGTIFSLYQQYHLFEIRRKKIAKLFKVKFIKQDPKRERWENIKKHFHSQNPSEWRVAIIDADVMLEDMVTSFGYTNGSFGEKLKSVKREHNPWLDDAWYVHILRNKLAHEGASYHLSEREAYQAMKIYENLFYSLGYIK